jgi:hypothetical protein
VRFDIVERSFSTWAVAKSSTPEGGTLIIAALLLLVLGFAGMWITAYAAPDRNPWALVPWFTGAAGVIIVIGVGLILFDGRKS